MIKTEKRTSEQIVTRISELKGLDFFGFEIADLVEFLPFSAAKEFLIDGVNEDDWEKDRQNLLSPSEMIKDYMSFAFDKALSERGLSAARSISHMCAWVWLDGKDQLCEQIREYSDYGLPQLRQICKEYGLDSKEYGDDQN